MNLLLDTHTILWFVDGSPRLSSAAKRIIEDSDSQSFVSIASLWEIGIKIGLKRLRIDVSIGVFVATMVERNGFELLPVNVAHIVEVASLPFHHRDPFDRTIVAQCRVENFSVVGADAAFDGYAVSRVW